MDEWGWVSLLIMWISWPLIRFSAGHFAVISALVPKDASMGFFDLAEINFL
jgi:hypothetical protein